MNTPEPFSPDVDNLPPSALPQGGSAFTATQLFFLRRMQRMLQTREDNLARLKPDDWRIKLLDRALYSTYRDCASAGVGQQAQALQKAIRQQRDN